MLLLLAWVVIVTLSLVDVLLLLALLGRGTAGWLRQTLLASPFAVALVTALMAPWRLWTLGLLAGVVALQAAAHLRWLRRARQTLGPAPAGLTAAVSDLARRWQTPAPSAVALGPAGPAVIGILRQTLVLPADALELAGPELAAVIAHELAHVRAHDPLKLWLLGVARTALGWHPLTRPVAERLSLEVEIAADRRAANWIGLREYALTLGRLGLRQAAVLVGQPAAGLSGHGSDLMLRLKALLGAEDPAPHLALAGRLGRRIAAKPRRHGVPTVVGLYLMVGYAGLFGLVQYLTR